MNCQESETKVKKNYVSSELIALIYLYIYTCGYRVKGERKTWATSGAALLLKGIEPGANCEEVVVLVELGC